MARQYPSRALGQRCWFPSPRVVMGMPKRPGLTSRWLTAASWPVGVALTSWDYMWRITPMRRQETAASLPEPPPELLRYPAHLSHEEVQGYRDGAGPLFHRCYRTRIRESRLTAEELMQCVQADPNRVSPTKFARFHRVHGQGGRLAVGDEYV